MSKALKEIIPHLSICLSCVSWDESFSLDEQVADTLSDTYSIHTIIEACACTGSKCFLNEKR